MNIYVVESSTGKRWVIVADSAKEAEDIAPVPSDENRNDLVVGRIGTYDPGITGTVMTSGFAVIAAQEA